VTGGYQDSARELIAVARGLMRDSAASWSSLAARLEVRDDEAWLDEGRRRYQASAAMQLSTPPEISMVSYLFSVSQTPWRLRMRLVRSVAAGNLQPPPDLIICRDKNWWARTGSEVMDNKAGTERRIGLHGLELMICPQQLADIMDFRDARETTREGRAAILVSAGSSEMAWRYAPEQVVLSASGYELEVDRQLGILLANRAYIDNRAAQWPCFNH
jgi:hypothetical protein